MRKSSKNVVEYTISDNTFIVYTLQHRSLAWFPLKADYLRGNRKSLTVASKVTRRCQNYYFLDSNLLFSWRFWGEIYYFLDDSVFTFTLVFLFPYCQTDSKFAARAEIVKECSWIYNIGYCLYCIYFQIEFSLHPGPLPSVPWCPELCTKKRLQCQKAGCQLGSHPAHPPQVNADAATDNQNQTPCLQNYYFLYDSDKSTISLTVSETCYIIFT